MEAGDLPHCHRAVHRRVAGADAGFGVGFAVLSLAFLASAFMRLFLPETRGRELT